LEVGGGEAPTARLDAYPAPVYRSRLSLRVSRVNEVLGTALSQPEVVSLLQRLHLPVVCLGEDALAVQAPSFRGDLEREIDLIEEIARLAGYDQIPVTLPRGELSTPRPGPEALLLQEARQLLQGQGFFEAVTYSFQSERLATLLTEEDDPGDLLHLANPLSEEQAVMRTSLLPGLLEALRRNTLKQVLDVRLFEASKVFLPEAGKELPWEGQNLSGVMYGARTAAAWNAAREPLDFFDLKGVVENLLEGLLIPPLYFHGTGLPGCFAYGARVFSENKELGFLGELQPEIGEKLDLEGPVFAFELDFEALAQTAAPPLFEALPRYPAIYRDLALVLLQEIPAYSVAATIFRHGQPWLEEVNLFDVYVGEPIPAGKRSLAFRLTYRDPERTLTEELINPHHQTLVEALASELGAELR
jgi:phenylalanyl-tRNA synthetase beta chain